MKINRFIGLVFTALLMSGCGDQVWCGENGCGAQRMVSNVSYSTSAQNASIVDSLL